MARRNFLLTLSYDGTDFLGWQRLPGGGRSVQGALESALESVLGERAEATGAGRTDAGVHAEGQAASFHSRSSLSCAGIEESLNARFPPDLSCRACREVDPRFHARFRAIRKTYRYRLLAGPRPDPFLRRYSLYAGAALDAPAMAEAGLALRGERDFRALSNAKGGDTVRRLDEVRVEERDAREVGGLAGGRIVDLYFSGPGFLYNQVRIMSALLLAAGRGLADPERAAAIADGRDRSAAPGALGPFGLCLVEVRYSFGS